MSYPTFTFKLDSENKSSKPKINKVEFGEGYGQRAPAGINNDATTWQVEYREKKGTDVDAVEAFLAERGGVYPFLWVPEGKTDPVTVVCEEWSVNNVHGSIVKTLSATFIKVVA